MKVNIITEPLILT